MALNRAQLLMGDSSKGVVIPGEAQGITDGVGLSIAAGGAISVDFATLIQAQAGASNIVASTPQTSVPKDASGMTGSAYIPAGTTAERPAAAAYTGQFRYNTQIPRLEFSDGSSWIGVATGTGVVAATLGEAQAGTLTTVFSSPQTAVPKDASGMTGSAYIPAGTTAQRPTASNYTGQFRYNTTIPQLEYSDGAAWQAVGAALLPASLAEAQAGTITTKYSSPQTAVPKDASGMTGSAYIPAGNTAQRPTASNYTGQFRYNTQIPQLEYSDGTNWISVVNINNSVTSFSTGTTGLTPAAATSGAVTLGGTLAVANGGTGGTTQATALTNLLPSQAGNADKVLGTDGTNVSWVVDRSDIPSGSVMPFYQASAPTGWTQVTAGINNSAIRIVSGAGGGGGGTLGFTSVFTNPYPVSGTINFTAGNVGSTTLTVAQLPSVTGGFKIGGTSGGTDGNYGAFSDGAYSSSNTDYGINTTFTSTFAFGSNDSHTHSLAGASSPASLNADLSVLYIDLIICSKN